MARQKPGQDQIARRVLEVQAAAEKANEESSSPSSGAESDIEDESESDDEEWYDIAHDEAFNMGDIAEKHNDLDRAISCYQQAIKKYVALGNEEVSPGAADYWLAYGHALLKKEEDSADLFHVEKAKDDDDDVDDDKQIAWESLDIARLAFSKRLEDMVQRGVLRRVPIACVWEIFIKPNPDAASSPYPLEQIKEECIKSVRNAIFTRLRLGDFCQAHHQFEEAISEFSGALQLCMEYGAPPNEALQATVPLAHCLMAADHEHTQAAFELALRLIDFELSLPTTPSERKAILQDLRPDLAAQVQEYLEERAHLKREAMQVFESIGFGDQPDETAEAPVDLGHVGKRRKKDSDAKKEDTEQP